MNPRELAELAAIGPRQSGRTTAICRAAKEANGIVVCASQEQADAIADRHGVKTIVPSKARGMTGPFFWDHYAVERIIADYADLKWRMEQLEK